MKNIFSKSRVETFSDGIFAIIITLLVLEIKVPHIEDIHSSAELGKALIGLLPKIISWIISFFTIAVIWVNHHKIFKQIKIMDAGLFWLNALLLLWCTLIPFPTAVLGDYPDNTVSIVLYGIVMALMAASFSVMRFYALSKPEVLEETLDIPVFRKGTFFSVLFGPVMYLSGLALGTLHPYLAFVIFIGIPVYFIFTETKN